MSGKLGEHGRGSGCGKLGEHGRGKHRRNDRRRVAASALSPSLNSPLALALPRLSGLAMALTAALFIAATIFFVPLAHAAKGDYLPGAETSADTGVGAGDEISAEVGVGDEPRAPQAPTPQASTYIFAAEATAADVTAADIVSNETELAVWVGEHANTGGTVALGADIVVTHGLYLGLARWSAVEGAVIRIETGDYGIRVADGGEVVLDDDVHVSGGGGLVPVIHVERGGRLGTDSSVAGKASVTADGADGIALLLEEGAEFYEYDSSAISLRATGAGGIALYTHAPFGSPDIEADEYTATGHIIEATAMGGKAIVSTLPIKLFLCRVTGDVAAVDAPEVALDACAVFPDVPGATVRTRTLRMADDTLREIGLAALGDQDRLTNLAITRRVHAELIADGAENISVTFNMSFDVSGVDANVLGSYPMPGNTPPAPYDLLANDFADVKIEIFDPAIPRFLSADILFMPPPLRYSFSYHYTGELPDLVLWRSDNGGEDWYQYWRGADGFTASENISVRTSGYLLSLVFSNPAEELTGGILFVFEVLSLQNDSRILRVNLTEDDFDEDGGIGGDRTGTDRVTDGDGGGVGSGRPGGGTGGGDGSGGNPGGNGGDGGNPGDGGNSGDTGGSGSTGGNGSGDGSNGPNGNGSDAGGGGNNTSNGENDTLGDNRNSGRTGTVAVVTPLSTLVDAPQTEPEPRSDSSSQTTTNPAAAPGPATAIGPAPEPAPAPDTPQSSLPEPSPGLPWYIVAAAVVVLICAAAYAVRRFRPFEEKSL